MTTACSRGRRLIFATLLGVIDELVPDPLWERVSPLLPGRPTAL